MKKKNNKLNNKRSPFLKALMLILKSLKIIVQPSNSFENLKISCTIVIHNTPLLENSIKFTSTVLLNILIQIYSTILGGKNFRSNLLKELLKIESWLLLNDLFYIFTQANQVLQIPLSLLK